MVVEDPFSPAVYKALVVKHMSTTEDINKFLTPEERRTTSELEKRRMSNLKKNYDAMTELGESSNLKLGVSQAVVFVSLSAEY